MLAPSSPKAQPCAHTQLNHAGLLTPWWPLEDHSTAMLLNGCCGPQGRRTKGSEMCVLCLVRRHCAICVYGSALSMSRALHLVLVVPRAARPDFKCGHALTQMQGSAHLHVLVLLLLLLLWLLHGLCKVLVSLSLLRGNSADKSSPSSAP